MSPQTGRPKSENPKSNPIHVRLDDETKEILEDYCNQEKIAKTEGIRKLKIKEEINLNLRWKVECPYCGNTCKIDLQDYVVDESEDEREMGIEIEYTIECEKYKCNECGKSFRIEGSVWEYPEGAYNDDSISVVELENEEDEEDDMDELEEDEFEEEDEK